MSLRKTKQNKTIKIEEPKETKELKEPKELTEFKQQYEENSDDETPVSMKTDNENDNDNDNEDEENAEIIIPTKGRKKKYATEEERKIARRLQQREYRLRKAAELKELQKFYAKTQKEQRAKHRLQKIEEKTKKDDTENKE